MIEFLKKQGQLSEEDAQQLKSLGREKSAAAGTPLFSAGQTCSKLWFVERGLIRSYRIIDGEEVTFFFFTEQSFAVDYESYLSEKISPLYFEAALDTEYREYHKALLEKIYRENPRMERLGRLMAERAYLSATERLKQHQTESLAERYQRLLDRAPQLFQQIPQYHIASYLGVKPQSLSRIKSELAGKPYKRSSQM